jgi:transposase
VAPFKALTDIIRLSLEGYSEKEIAKQTDSTLSAVTKIRKMFKDFAWTVLTDLALLQQTTDNRQQKADNRKRKAERDQYNGGKE